MKILISSIFIVLLYGCSVGSTSQYVSRPACPDKKNTKYSGADYVYSLLTCGDKQGAVKFARAGADSGDVELSNIYIQILASDNDARQGLSYAIKGAELGDFESAVWVMRISRDGGIESLDSNIEKWYLSYFKSNPEYPFLGLEEFLRYATMKISYGSHTAASYGVVFYKLSEKKLRPSELVRAKELLAQLNSTAVEYGVSDKLLRESANILN